MCLIYPKFRKLFKKNPLLIIFWGHNVVSIVLSISATSIMKQCLMTSQILKSVDFTKTQKSRYLENEQNIFLKKISNYTSRATLMQKKFIVEVTYNTRNRELNFKNTFSTLCPLFLFHIFNSYMYFDTLITDAS